MVIEIYGPSWHWTVSVLSNEALVWNERYKLKWHLSAVVKIYRTHGIRAGPYRIHDGCVVHNLHLHSQVPENKRVWMSICTALTSGMCVYNRQKKNMRAFPNIRTHKHTSACRQMIVSGVSTAEVILIRLLSWQFSSGVFSRRKLPQSKWLHAHLMHKQSSGFSSQNFSNTNNNNHWNHINDS